MKAFELTPNGKLPSYDDKTYENMKKHYGNKNGTGFMICEFYAELFSTKAKEKGASEEEVERIKQLFLNMDWSEYNEYE